MSRITLKQRTTIDEAFGLYITEKKLSGLAAKSISDYEETYCLFKKSFSEFPTKIQLLKWINDMSCSISSKNHRLRNLRAFFYYCMDNGYMGYYKIELLKGQSESIKFFSESDLKKLLIKPSKKDFCEFRTYAIICFILATGARASTVVNIRFSDIDFERKEVTYTHLKDKKTAIIPISSALFSTLLEYRKSFNRTTDWLFPDCYENQLTPNALRQALIKYCKKHGVEPRGPHALRHSFARGWILNNGNAFTLQKMLCHSDLTMTKNYVRLFGAELHKDLEAYSPLDKLLVEKHKIK